LRAAERLPPCRSSPSDRACAKRFASSSSSADGSLSFAPLAVSGAPALARSHRGKRKCRGSERAVTPGQPLGFLPGVAGGWLSRHSPLPWADEKRVKRPLPIGPVFVPLRPRRQTLLVAWIERRDPHNRQFARPVQGTEVVPVAWTKIAQTRPLFIGPELHPAARFCVALTWHIIPA